MTPSSAHRLSRLGRTLKALEQDLIDESGPRISTMRNYRFAIAVYDPDEEWELRQGISALSGRLTQEGWIVHTISLQHLFLDRIQRIFGERGIESLITLEKKLHKRGTPTRALNALTQKIFTAIEGPDGLAADVAAEIDALIKKHPDEADRIIVFIGRAGALYPFLRTSALLKFLDGRTHQVPVILLYPGEKKGDSGLSFMGVTAPDRDYRPRIYTSDSLKI